MHGNGRDPGMNEILEVGSGIGLPAGNARWIAEEIRERVREDLGVYLNERMISGESIVDGS